MNWNQDWDYEANGDGWRDGRSDGLRSSSAGIIPRSIARRLARMIFIVLAMAGLAGGLFQAYLCIRIVTHVVKQPRVPTTPQSGRERLSSPSPTLLKKL